MAVTYASNVFTITQNASAPGTGTISGAPTTVTIGGIAQPATLITGVGTAFSTQLRAGSLIVAGANQFIVHSVASATSLVAFLRSHANAAATFSSTAFTFHAPTLWSELVTAVQGQAATIAATDGRLDIIFTDASVTTNANAVLVADLFVSMSFGAANARRFNHNLDAVLILRNGGHFTFNGDVRFNWFNGWLNVPNGVLTWQGHVTGSGGGWRQDFLNGTNTRSNGIAAFAQISAGGVAGAWRQYVLLDGVGSPPKIGSIVITNNVQVASSGSGEAIYLQFQSGTYSNVMFPSVVSTFGVTQPYLVYLSRTGTNLTTLRSPSFPGDSYALAYDLTNITNDTYLVNEIWRDRSTPGALTLGNTNGTNSGQRHHRIFEWSPGTYFTAGGWNVRLRDSQATPTVVQNGIVTASTPLQMEWQMVAMINGVVTTNNYGPFRLLARKPGFVSRYETFTPTAPRTEAFVPEVDATYTSDQSARAGIAGNNATNTITISSGTHTLDQFYDWFQHWMAQPAQMAAYPDVARVDSVSGSEWSLPTGWTLVVGNGAVLNAGAKLTTIFVPSVTLNGTITAVYRTTSGTSSILEMREVSSGSAYCVYDATTKATISYGLNSTGSNQTYRVYFAPGSAGLMIGIVKEKYGFQRAEEVVPLAPGLSFLVATDIPDVGISETNQATVAAYTSVDTADRFYDRTALFRLTEAGIKLGQITTRDGTDLDVSAPYSVVINQSAPDVYAISGNTITLRATGYANGTRYTNTVLVPPATLTAATNEILSANFEDANGDSSVTILGGDGVFELWRVPTSTPTADYQTGVKLTNPTIGNTRYRFIGVAGFDIVGVDINSNVRRRSSMAKGIYTQSFYVGDQIQLAQAPQVNQINTKVDLLLVDLAAVKGAGFVTSDHSLAAGGDKLAVVNRGVQRASLSVPHTEAI